MWATDLISWTARTSSSGSDTYTSGYTYSMNKVSGDNGFVKDSGTKDKDIVSMTLYKTDAALFATAPVEITFNAKLGGGATKDPLDYNIYACFVDNTGAEISGTTVTVTTKITSTTGSDFSVNMPISYATSAYGIKIYHMKENGWNARYYNFTLSYSNVATPTWTLSPASATVTAGESIVLDLTTNYDGTLNFESENEDVATVSYNSSTKKVTVNGIARGTTTINVTGDATANYKAIDKSISVIVKKAIAYNCIMYESFDANDATGGNDGTWKNISATPTPVFDLTGWTYATAYGASKCVRIGGNGYFLSPAFGVAGNVTLKFKIESWGTDGSTGYIDVVNGGTFDNSESISGVTFAESNTRAQVTLAKTGTWTEYTLKINGVTANTKIKLLGPGTKRVFFDEVEVLLDKASAKIKSAEYATFVCPIPLDFSTTGVTVYTATDNKTSVSLNEITSGKVPANTPVVLYKAGADGTAINVPVIASADAVGDNDLRVSTGTDVDYMYVLAKPAEKSVGFYPWGGTNLSAGKVYLQAKASYGARAFLGFNDDVTAIEAVKAQNVVKGEYFNLAGQRVAQPNKGLYIVNGKKVVNK